MQPVKETEKAHNTLELPKGYDVVLKLDLQKNKKIALLVNGIAALIAVLLVGLGCFWVPITTLFQFDDGMKMYFLRFGILLVGIILYTILHELIHGIFMKQFSRTKVTYGFTGLYAYAGSEAYFNKSSYLIIALAPVVVWGLVLLCLNLFLNYSWFWVVFTIKICNLSGAAGDLYVTYRFSKMPADILVRDTGVAMTVYAPVHLDKEAVCQGTDSDKKVLSQNQGHK